MEGAGAGRKHGVAMTTPPPGFVEVLILKVDKVVCFHRDLKVLIVKRVRDAAVFTG